MVLWVYDDNVFLSENFSTGNGYIDSKEISGHREHQLIRDITNGVDLDG